MGEWQSKSGPGQLGGEQGGGGRCCVCGVCACVGLCFDVCVHVFVRVCMGVLEEVCRGSFLFALYFCGCECV